MCTFPNKDAIAAQEALVGALANPVCYPHPVERVRVIETHISHVLLTGRYAYKIKKPVALGFLDFSTLERRRFYCEEELRLNRRLAPQMYLDVVAIGGTPQAPQLGVPAEEAIEYAVKMREFPQEALLDHRLGRGELSTQHIDAIAAVVAAFHQRVERASPQQDYGSAASVQMAVWQTFAQIRPLLGTAAEREALGELEAWSEREHATLLPLFVERQCQGYIRECHGDLHLGNIALVDDEIQVFDGIEFNPNLRWIDIISEIAFLVMDLDEHGRPDLAWRFLNRYLEETGDYAGMRLLRYYQVYRAMVRAKVARIRAAQAHIGEEERQTALHGYAAYLDHARRMTQPAVPALILMHGLSGSGKTYASQGLLEGLGALRLRSDVERKRLHDLRPLQASGSGLGEGLYAEAATRATYERLASLAAISLGAGYTTIVDAAFLQRWQRDRFRGIATARGVPFLIAHCHAEEPEMAYRLVERARQDASEATVAVMQHQRLSAEPLADDEIGDVVVLNTQRDTREQMRIRVADALARRGRS